MELDKAKPTIETLQQYTGQMESLRLEFKSSKLFNNSQDKIADELSKVVSAFANTEGGRIVIGIWEKSEGKTKAAGGIDDGVNFYEWFPEKLQNIIESNVHPLISGIRIYKINLSDNSKCAYIIDVPKGTTAYQARDFCYYGRSEYSCNPLRDHDIRLRMNRGKVPTAEVRISSPYVGYKKIASRNLLSSNVVYSTSKAYLELSKAPEDTKHKIKEYIFDISIINIGEINVNEFKVIIDFEYEGLSTIHQINSSFRDGDEMGGYFRSTDGSKSFRKLNIYPHDKEFIARQDFYLHPDDKLPKIEANWTLYLRDTFPIKGHLNITEELKKAHESIIE